MRYVFLVSVTVFWVVLEAGGQEPSSKSPAAYVEQLGADDYVLRRQATDALRKLGRAARPLLEAAATSADSEIRLRARGLIQDLLVDELWDGSRVSMSVKRQPVSHVFLELAECTGNLFMLDEGQSDFHDALVSITATSAPFWKVVDQACRLSGNRVCTRYNRSGMLAVVKSGPGAHPVGYAGPLRVHLDQAKRIFTEELEYESARSVKSHVFEMNLQLMWESRFLLVAYRSTPRIVEAVTDNGVSVEALLLAPGSWMMTSGGRSQAARVRVQPPPPSARLLKTLRLRWELFAIGDMAVLDIADLSAATHYQDDIELEFSGVQETSGGRYEVVVTVSRGFFPPEPSEVMLVEHVLELFDDAGNSFHQASRSNVLADRGVVTKVLYAGAADGRRPARLRFTYPRIRSQREVEFLLHEVPLPHAVP